MENSVQVYAQDEMVFCEGEFQPWMYVIEQGRVGIYARHDMPEEKLLTTLEAGQCFGEMGMLEGMARSATAVALEDETRLVRVTSADFGDYYLSCPQKILEIMRHMSGRIREMTGEYIDACRTADEMMRSKEKNGWLKTQIDKLRRALSDTPWIDY